MRLRRAFLYTPGNDLDKVKKACGLGADCVCLDLEDSVSISSKEEARMRVTHAMGNYDFGQAERLIRLNAPNTPFFLPDLRISVHSMPDGYVIPKVESAETLQYLDGFLEAFETKQGIDIGSIILIAIIESAQSFLNLEAICRATPRLKALVFGAEDMAVSLGARRTASNKELFYARSQLVLYAAAFGLDAIDLVCNDFAHVDILEREALEGAQLGYCGKQVIHPNQIKIVQKAFSPSEEDVQKARTIVAEYEERMEQGDGALGYKGSLVDMPVYRQAKQVLEKAELISKLQ